MPRRYNIIISLLFTALLLMSGLIAPRPALALELTIGTISDEPRKKIKKFGPFTRHLAKQLKRVGVKSGRVVVASSLQQMAEYLKKGRVLIYFDSPLVSMVVNELAGSTMAFRRWKKGVSSYYTVIFTRKDSGIKTLDDLKGHTIGFEEAFSSSGYLLPMMVLRAAGIETKYTENLGLNIPRDRVGYVFTDDDENTMTWVMRKKISAGAMSHADYYGKLKDSTGKLRVVQKTFSIPRQVGNFSKHVDTALGAAIKQVLYKMPETSEGKKVLKVFDKTKKFDPMPADTVANLKKYKAELLGIISK